MFRLPANITPSTKEAYNWVYGTLYWMQTAENQFLIGRAKRDEQFSCREVEGFLKVVTRVAEYIPTPEELEKWKKEDAQKPLLTPKPVDVLGVGIVTFEGNIKST